VKVYNNELNFLTLADVKRVAEIQRGVMTQCVTYKTVSKPSRDTLSNLVFKINMKMGGINCVLKTREMYITYILIDSLIALKIDIDHNFVGFLNKSFCFYTFLRSITNRVIL